MTTVSLFAFSTLIFLAFASTCATLASGAAAAAAAVVCLLFFYTPTSKFIFPFLWKLFSLLLFLLFRLLFFFFILFYLQA